MATEALTVRKRRSLWASRNGVLLAGAIVSGAVAWWMIAWPVATLANVAAHKGHFALTFAHMVGGTGMLFLGGLNLYLAARNDSFPLHRTVGKAYLAFGAFGATVAMIITSTPAHKSAGGPILTTATVSLLTLASAWLCFAALGWRAARNRRFTSHAQWMVRSYVLVWSFVFCRIASRVVPLDEDAFIWLSWVGPLLVCEMVLHWDEGARKLPRTPRVKELS
ncbi:MAG: DUF2306 domain-containing protein [Sphingomicrobium sp.]